MTILLLLVPISVLLLGIAVWALLWAVRSGQYDDLDAPAIDMLRSDGAGTRSPPLPTPARDAD